MSTRTKIVKGVALLAGLQIAVLAAGVQGTEAATKTPTKGASKSAKINKAPKLRPPTPIAVGEDVSFTDPVDPFHPDETRQTYSFRAVPQHPVLIESDRPFQVTDTLALTSTPSTSGDIESVPIVAPEDKPHHLLVVPTLPVTEIVSFQSPDGEGGRLSISEYVPDKAIPITVGTPVAIDFNRFTTHTLLANLSGGKRYRVLSSDPISVTVEPLIPGFPVGQKNTSAPAPSQAQDIVPFADGQVLINLRANDGDKSTITVTQVADDKVVDPGADGGVKQTSEPDAQVVVPMWGPAGQRVIFGSPDATKPGQFGQTWIERDDKSTTYLVPFQFRTDAKPFFAWGGVAPTDYSAFVFRGDDPVFPLTVGGTTTATNPAWLRALVPFTLVQGHRYQIDLVGDNLRNAGFAIRGPEGRRATSAADWNYDDPKDTGDFRHVSTTIDAHHGGSWVLEIDPRGATVANLAISLREIDGRVNYEPVVNVSNVLAPGLSQDIDLLPGEWTQMMLKTGDSAVQVEPVAMRYRNTTFDLTAADVTVWDADGRLVYSNNKNLEEEVFTGRLGKESNAAERFVLLRPNSMYRVVLDPVGDLAGRFRLSLGSTNQTQILGVDLTKGPVKLNSTQVGILEVRKGATGVALKGSACFTSSLLELKSPLCESDSSVTLAPGIYSVKSSGEATLSSAAAGVGSPITSSVRAELGSSVDLKDGVTEVTVAANANDLIHIDLKNADVVRTLDPSGLPVDPAQSNFYVGGDYKFYVKAGGAAIGQPKITFSKPLLPYTIVELAMRQQTPFSTKGALVTVAKITKPAGELVLREYASGNPQDFVAATTDFAPVSPQDLAKAGTFLVIAEVSSPYGTVAFDTLPSAKKKH